jgi:TPP-dependent pyruvate/acetoin dehydrogenase alpha subunit
MPMLARIFRSLYRIRRVEEEVARVYPTDVIKSPVHLSIGQEAVAVGVCEALRPDDVVFATYRSHAAYLAKGGDLRRMIAELYGKVTGCAKGKGGSMHLVDAAHGIMGTSAVVGTTIPNSVGYAYAFRVKRSGRIVVSFFGDGAADEGSFSESLNFAALRGLPVLFVCENNGYAIHSAQRARQRVPNLCARVQSYGVPVERIEGNDVLAIRERASVAVDQLRDGTAGPWFLECMTYRWKEHVGPNEDFHLGYRSREEAEPWIRNDQVARIGEMLLSAQREAIEREVEAEIREAFDFAGRSAFPGATELHTDVFAGA